MSHPVRVVLLALAVLAALTGVSVAAPPPAVKGHTAAASAAEVAPPPAEGAAVTVTLTNTPSSPQSFGSAEVRLPTGAGLTAASASVSRSGWSVTARTEG